MDKNIPTLKAEFEISKNIYKGIFDKLNEASTLKDLDHQMNLVGNKPWFIKYLNYFREDKIESPFPPESEGGQPVGIIHTASHNITGSAHTNKGENQTLITERLLRTTNIDSGTIKYFFERFLHEAKGYLMPQYSSYTTVNELNYDKSKQINSSYNIHLNRVAFNSMFAISSLKEDLGEPFHQISFVKIYDLPAKFFKPNDIMFDAESSFLTFDKNGIRPKDGLDLPKTTITLINRSCEMINKISAGETLIIS